MKNSREAKAVTLLLLAAFMWGSSFVASKICLNAGLYPFETVFYRAVLGVTMMAVVWHRQLRQMTKKACWVGVVMGITICTTFSLEMTALAVTESSKAALLTATNIVMMPFLYALFFRRKIVLRSVAAAILSILGVAALTQSAGSGFTLVWGDVLLLLTALAYGFNSIAGAKLQDGTSAVQVTFMQMVTLAVYTGCMTLVQGRCGNYPSDAVAAIVFLAIGPTVICFLIKNYAIKILNPVTCSLILSTETVFCVILSAMIFHEEMSGQKLLGMVLVLSGILLQELQGKKKVKDTAQVK